MNEQARPSTQTPSLHPSLSGGHGQAPEVAQRKPHPSPCQRPKDSLPYLDLAAAPDIPAVPWDLANYLHTVSESGHNACQTHA